MGNQKKLHPKLDALTIETFREIFIVVLMLWTFFLRFSFQIAIYISLLLYYVNYGSTFPFSVTTFLKTNPLFISLSI
jgi:hypothetical protein